MCTQCVERDNRILHEASTGEYRVWCPVCHAEHKMSYAEIKDEYKSFECKKCHRPRYVGNCGSSHGMVDEDSGGYGSIARRALEDQG